MTRPTNGRSRTTRELIMAAAAGPPENEEARAAGGTLLWGDEAAHESRKPTTDKLGFARIRDSEGPPNWPKSDYYFIVAHKVGGGGNSVVAALGPLPSRDAAEALSDRLNIMMGPGRKTSGGARARFFRAFQSPDLELNREMVPWQWAIASGFVAPAGPEYETPMARQVVQSVSDLTTDLGRKALDRVPLPTLVEIRDNPRFRAAAALASTDITAIAAAWAAIANAASAIEIGIAPPGSDALPVDQFVRTVADTYQRSLLSAPIDAIQRDAAEAQNFGRTRATGVAIAAPIPPAASLEELLGESEFGGLFAPIPSAPPAGGAGGGSAVPTPMPPLTPIPPPAPAPAVAPTAPAPAPPSTAAGSALPPFLAQPQVKALLDAFGRVLETARTAVYRLPDGSIIRASPRDVPPPGSTLVTHEWAPISQKALTDAYFGPRRAAFDPNKTIQVAGRSPYATGTSAASSSISEKTGRISLIGGLYSPATQLSLKSYRSATGMAVKDRAYMVVPGIERQSLSKLARR